MTRRSWRQPSAWGGAYWPPSDVVAFAVEMGDEKAIAADMHEYLSMFFYSAEARDTFKARSMSFSYHQKVNKGAVWSNLQRFDLNPELPKFKFPTLVVTGRYDFNVAPSVAWAIHKAIRSSSSPSSRRAATCRSARRSTASSLVYKPSSRSDLAFPCRSFERAGRTAPPMRPATTPEKVVTPSRAGHAPGQRDGAPPWRFRSTGASGWGW